MKRAGRSFALFAAMIGVVGGILGIVLNADELGLIHIVGDNGRVPTAEDRFAWNEATNASVRRCSALRRYLQSFPDGAFARQAESLLNARTSVVSMTWTPFGYPSMATGSSTTGSTASEAEACMAATESLQRNAQSGCDLYAANTATYRNVVTRVAEGECSCSDLSLGLPQGANSTLAPAWHCTVRSSFQCSGEHLSETSVENCGE